MNGSADKRFFGSRQEDLRRIAEALSAATALLLEMRHSAAQPEFKNGGDPVTAADRAANELLLRMLPRNGEGWLSEESKDDPSRLSKRRVWVVDPLDGTKEFVAGIPEWCVSVGLIEDGRAVAGGVSNPTTGEVFLGSLESGLQVTGNGKPKPDRPGRDGVVVLASRSEVSRGKWRHLERAPFAVQPVGSVAYRLACVAAGFADATWTLDPRHEWDVAAGVALILAAGGEVKVLDGSPPVFNLPIPRFEGLAAFSPGGRKRFEKLPPELRRFNESSSVERGRQIEKRLGYA